MAKFDENAKPFSQKWMDDRLAVTTLKKVLSTEYWIPKDINFLWAMGMILAATFGLLLVSGIFLLMYYKPDVNMAFDSVNYTIMTEVGYGWLWRHIHGVAASIVFLIIYIHMFTGIYYGSYKKGREMIWISGMLLFVTFSAEAFSGYMLPWGQMSYWAGMVITNLFEGFSPDIMGGALNAPGLVEWIRGDYVPDDAFLTRFFMLHVLLLPLVIIGLIVLHFGTLRIPHVNNQTGAMDPVNFDPADGLKTPPHIYPEWYFLWSYEILRPFPKDPGLIAFGIAQVALFMIPFIDRSPNVAPANKRGLFHIWFWVLVIDMIVLTVMGKLPPEGIWNTIGMIAAVVFLLLGPALYFITKAEKKL